MEWNNGVTAAKYAYIQNLQGDIVGIVDSNGTEVVKYTYDAWGRVLSATGSLAATLGTVQPFRYRGYVYDVETGLYYLRSRYYNPMWGRFINADVLMKENLYCYCENNPLVLIDSSGKSSRYLNAPEYDFEIFDEPLMEEHKVFIATICGEAIGESKESWIAVAWVIMNRFKHREWKKYETITEIITETGFNGYNSKQYKKCMDYLNQRDGSNRLYEEVISAVMPVYFLDISDTTNYATMYYSPRPGRNGPSFSRSPRVEEVMIEGVDSESFRFYKYIGDDDPYDVSVDRIWK